MHACPAAHAYGDFKPVFEAILIQGRFLADRERHIALVAGTISDLVHVEAEYHARIALWRT